MDYWIWSLIVILIIYIIIKIQEKKNYYKKWGIPRPTGWRCFLGFQVLLGDHWSKIIQRVYKVDTQAKYIGCFMFINPMIVVRDLELIKSILVKNFDHFSDHQTYVDPKDDPLFANNLAIINGEQWHEVRALLSPAFTSSKMRLMYVLMSNCAKSFTNHFLDLYREKEEINMKDIFTRYTNDVIATCAFGIEVDSLKHPKNEFYINGRESTTFGSSILMKVMILRISPWLSKLIGIRFISKKNTDFFINLIDATIKERDKNGIKRPDMLQLMMDGRKKLNDLDLIKMAAQAFIFFLGGFETVSSVMCMMAHELAMNPDIQEKLQNEIDITMDECNGELTYEIINNLIYLDAVFNETLRMHSVGFLSRVCSKDFELPPTLPESKPYIIKKGSEILIAAPGVYHDPDLYEEPDKFNPERYLNKKITLGDVTNLGFGMGPRSCIGNRFAILEVKVFFVHLLHKCSFDVCKKTCIPLKYDRISFSPVPKGGCWLKIKPRN